MMILDRIPKQRCSKGVMFTLDSSLALSLFFMLILFIFAVNLRNPAHQSASMAGFCESALSSLEEDGTLAASSSANLSSLRQALNGMPQEICASVRIVDSANATVSQATREGCGYGKDRYVFRRSFYNQGHAYMAYMEAWSE